MLVSKQPRRKKDFLFDSIVFDSRLKVLSTKSNEFITEMVFERAIVKPKLSKLKYYLNGHVILTLHQVKVNAR